MKIEEPLQLNKGKPKLKAILQHLRISFRSLRWSLTMSYAIVTIGALLVAEIIISVMLMSYFVTNLDLTPETLITNLSAEWIPQVREFFSENPPDVDGLRAYLEDVQGSVIETKPLLIFGNLELQMKAKDFLSFYYLLSDRTLVTAIPNDIVPEEDIGTEISFNYLPGLADPLRAALRGEEDWNLLYAKIEPGIGSLAPSRCSAMNRHYRKCVRFPINQSLIWNITWWA